MAGKKTRQRTSSTTSQGSPPVVTSGTTPATTGSRQQQQQLQQQRTPEDLAGLTKQQLQVECRKRGQKTTGTKVELLQRLGHKMSSKRHIASSSATANGSSAQQPLLGKTEYQKSKQRDKEEREGLVIWKRPLKTTEYFIREFFVLIYTYGRKSLQYRKALLITIALVTAVVVALRSPGPHQIHLSNMQDKVLWCAYWIGLGILSSVGLGTGLHTFLLYLGPHIAKVTLAAYECGTLDFPKPPYPDEIICPEMKGDSMAISIFAIMSKVRLEAMCWGAGTALGELPPYFMAKAARLSGFDPDDEDDDLAEFEELQKKRKEDLTLIERGKLFVEQIVQRVGFFGILACASIPNPLFDLAGITCGHFLVPFWTFFGATLIGKAIIKMHIQKMFVIIAFNEILINKALSWLTIVPVIGSKLEQPFRTYLDGQKSKLHSGGTGGEADGGSLLAAILEKFVVAMILYFVVSIVNSFAQSYHKRLSKRKSGKTYKD